MEIFEFTEADFPIGTVSHQGDVILIRLAALPESAQPRKNRQVADGNTQGSRHVVTVGNVFDCNKESLARTINYLAKEMGCNSCVKPEYVGPVFQTTDGIAKLEHPGHGDHHYTGDMTIGCIYQRNLDAEEREARVRD